MTFSEKLYQLRKARGLSQENLAGHLGVSRQAVQKWETGASTPDVGNLVAISEYFQVSLDSLLKDTGEAFVSPDNGDCLLYTSYLLLKTDLFLTKKVAADTVSPLSAPLSDCKSISAAAPAIYQPPRFGNNVLPGSGHSPLCHNNKTGNHTRDKHLAGTDPSFHF